MRLHDLNPDFYSNSFNQITEWAEQPSLWQENAQSVLFAMNNESASQSVDSTLALAQRVQTVRTVFSAQLQTNSDFHAVYNKTQGTQWHEWETPPVAPVLQQRVGDLLCQTVAPGPKNTLVQLGPGSAITAAHVVSRLKREGRKVLPYFSEQNMLNMAYTYATPDGLKTMADLFLQDRKPIQNLLQCLPANQSNVTVPENQDGQNMFWLLADDYSERKRRQDIKWCVHALPTRKEADYDGLPYDLYAQVAYEACDQPWEKVFQEQERLKEILDKSEMLHFTNKDGTDLRMSFKGQTFSNCMLDINIPGSECFSAPELYSANGLIVANGAYAPPTSGKVARDLRLELKDGFLTSWDAREGKDVLDEAFNIDKGARYLGEGALGTNPHLRRSFLNIFLGEKAGASFHVAFGNSYKNLYDEQGRPVNLNNGNDSQLHWDITTMLFGREGRVMTDGKPLIENGFFVGQEFDVLNYGWAAIPKAQRPEHWQNYQGPFTETGYRKIAPARLEQ